MSNPELKNIIQAQIQENEKTRQKIGCFSPKGCTKGKEFDHFIDGVYRSDKNDIREFIKKQTEINEIVGKKHSEAMMMLSDVLSKFGELLGKINSNEEKVNAMSKVVEKVDLRMWAIAAAIVLMCVGTVWNIGRVNSVDRDNQQRTESILTVLATNISGKSREQIKHEINIELKKGEKIK